MDFEFSPEQQAFRTEVSEYIRERVNKPGVLSDGMGVRYVDTPERRAFIKELAEGGYLGVSWDVEYGGKGLSIVYDYILNEELAEQAAPTSGKGVGIIGRSIQRQGTDQQKEELLPQILRGDIEWAIGYSEPDSGSDLASLKLRATRDGDGWRLNGQKRFTTSAHFADWYFLAARTSTGEKKHQGITMFLLRMDTPGLEVHGMECMNGERTNEVFFDDVYVPDSQVLGEVGKGFYYISEALDFERHALFPWGQLHRQFNTLVRWARSATIDGAPVRENSEVREALSKLAIDLELVRLLSVSVVFAEDADAANIGSAMNKIAASEYYRDISDAALDLMGPGAWFKEGSEGAVADGIFEQLWRSSVIQTVGAGSNEIQRNIISRRGLGLPNPV